MLSVGYVWAYTVSRRPVPGLVQGVQLTTECVGRQLDVMLTAEISTHKSVGCRQSFGLKAGRLAYQEPSYRAFRARAIIDAILFWHLFDMFSWPLFSTPKMFKASDCGRLGHQAADRPWSALRVVKSYRKDCPTVKRCY